MIYDAFLVPHESPTLLREVKRALLTYDHVFLADPNDRDVIPSNAFMAAVFGLPFGMDMGPIRPQGKVDGYDDTFQCLIDSCDVAIKQGVVSIQSTYERQETGVFTIGAVPTGGYPLNIGLVFQLYRGMAGNQALLLNAVEATAPAIIREAATCSSLVLTGRGDGGINDIPALPLIESDGLSSDERDALTSVARSRIASFIKYAGYCEAKNLVPVFANDVYGRLAETVINNAHSTLAQVDTDSSWRRRNRVLELCHEEHLIDARLDEMTVREVIALRTRAWGNQASARETLFQSVALIADEVADDVKFEDRVRAQVSEYRKESEELVRERSSLEFKLKCDIAAATLAGGSGLVGLMSQIQSPLMSMGATLAVGGIWAFEKAKDYVPQLQQLRADESELKRGAAFGIHDFYSRLER